MANSEFDGLSWSSYGFADGTTAKAVVTTEETHSDHIEAYAGTLCQREPTGTAVRWTSLFAVMSIQERTRSLDALTAEIDDTENVDFGTLKGVLERTTDGAQKWDSFQSFWTGDVPEQVAEELRAENWLEAVALLCGLERGHTARERESYMRVAKAHLVTGFFGDPDALCLDSARLNSLAPLIKAYCVEEASCTSQASNGPFRGKTRPANLEPVRIHEEPKKWFQDVLTRNPREYRAFTREVLDALEGKTGLGRREIDHALFLSGKASDEDTHHEALIRLLE